ncbi:L-alanine-DL-glutamate epimerase-like enolase superfamily enzyme [Scopulibacillus darangshiensis]|uniref:Dipeptide epimerase n=1 Tax=Scopulibacillus darangshiensis TaxID=442528 RepID=A0A4R2NJJ8_9BACL|nr:dipeptide epimerase [Scopulibacillus darangshiensis]TCP21512.1 L-alanine-DL-glutamate epimerase-like enolase superfamily enzyme [Scopulibacillus darangshiensis]
MKIKKATLYAVQLPLVEPFIVSYKKYTAMPSIIVRLETEDGFIGFGEGTPDEHVTGETYEGTFKALQHYLLPIIINHHPFDIEDLHEKMDRILYGNPTAKAAIDIACYDLMGKITQKPVYQLIGGCYHQRLHVTKVISINDPEVMAKEALQSVSAGYQSLKIKVGTTPEDDMVRLRGIKEAIDTLDTPVKWRVDVNQGWRSPIKVLPIIKGLENLGIDWLEQPILADDIEGLNQLRKNTSIPIMIDEGLKNSWDLRRVINYQAADIINIKLMKCGGIYPALKLVSQAEMGGLTCQIGSMVESSVASSAGIHLSAAKKNIISNELTGPLLFKNDIGDLAYKIPYIYPPEVPGLGIKVDENKLLAMTEDKLTIN